MNEMNRWAAFTGMELLALESALRQLADGGSAFQKTAANLYAEVMALSTFTDLESGDHERDMGSR